MLYPLKKQSIKANMKNVRKVINFDILKTQMTNNLYKGWNLISETELWPYAAKMKLFDYHK